MFDPLDLYTPEDIADAPPDQVNLLLSSKDSESIHDSDFNDEDENLPIDSLDLPSVHYAPPEAILCILLLLKPTDQINFQHSKDSNLTTSQICLQKGISMELINATVKYYQTWGNKRLDTEKKICEKIPTLATIAETLLNYYTLILKHYEKTSNWIQDQIVKEASMRICENCGRTALPTMSRRFTFENFSRNIEIYEPSLTADNLGWKTWGSSFILSQKLIKIVPHFNPTKLHRVLELGSGTGLAGISWLMKWIEIHGNSNIEMFFTDLQEIVPNLRKNVEINGISDNSVVDTLDWTCPEDFVDKYSSEKFDIIIVSDPIYSPNHPKLVVDMISLFLSTNGICHLEIPLRDKYSKERNSLWELLEKNSLQVIEQENDQGMDDWGKVNYLYQRIEWKKK
ncbi:ZYRO0G20548p [Zygosaccharomyces rouxii]|uniref:ZYRO0G20548p n=1 Tax=Zygosaccharomyces rouxii (strain ATCC 2623 / CBS 732 / NBRC 1130 / NCYC 568 / NRRL Y-229) TaxID=559307 RepID=C5E1F4_ZYGRC|nr:uncharacterized protein ZYRO0G20548g [Zygosaccharomyces rouxii]KAH9202929.1 putative methyltransferase-domain-containing protein [Zygosaccharomyces rouxii]CAR29938.1 ZYRO0G20548p [Zygosaccharomyces rouxii]